MKMVVPTSVTRANLVSSVLEVLPVTYDAADNYQPGCWVEDGGDTFFMLDQATYQDNTGLTPASNPTVWQETTETLPAIWDVATAYVAGDIVYHYAALSSSHFGIFRALGNTTGDIPYSSATDWELLYYIYQGYIHDETYPADVYVIHRHNIYLSLHSGNVGALPDESPADWEDQGVAPRWAMFDNKTSTQTEYGEDIEVAVAVAGRIDSLGLLEVDGSDVNITVMSEDGLTELFNEDYSLTATDGISDWWAFFFTPVEMRRELIVYDLPTDLNPNVTVTLTGTGTRAIGHFTLGVGRTLGRTLYGAKLGIDDFSRFETDDFGNRYIVERSYSRRGDYTVIVERVDVNGVYRLLSQYRATPALFIPTEEYSSTFLFGRVASWSIGIDYPEQSTLNINLEGF